MQEMSKMLAVIVTNGKLEEIKELLTKKGYNVEIGELNSIGGIKIMCLIIQSENMDNLEELKEYDGVLEIIDLSVE
jgi:transcriptional regulator of aromatic amino acid metabolism